MMYARIVNSIVQEVIDFDPNGRFTAEVAEQFVPVPDGVGPGDIGNGDGTFTKFVPSPSPKITPYKSWPAFDFYRKFTPQERIAVRELAKTDVVAQDFYETLQAAIASLSNVRSDDPDTLQGMQYLVSKNCLSIDRLNTILEI